MKKLLILIGFFTILLSSCKTIEVVERIVTKDSTIVRDSIIYRDVIIHDTIQGDTIYKDRLITRYMKPIRLENKYAISNCWVENNKLKSELILKQQVIDKIIKDGQTEINHWKEKYTTEKKNKITIEKEKYIPKFYKFTFWFFMTSVLSGIFFVIFKFKLYRLV